MEERKYLQITDYKTNYVKNEDNRSHYNSWRKDLNTKGYVRLNSNPKFSRTQSKGTYR